MRSFFPCCEDVPIQPEMVIDDSSVNIKIYDKIPMYIKESQYNSYLSQCQRQKHSFIDPEFPPAKKALGQYQSTERKITWKRIVQLVQKPCVYSLGHHPAESILTLTSSGSHITAALVALALKPNKIYNIFGHQRNASIYGIYNLKVKIRGVLKWMVIDDFMPVFADTDRPLLCGTFNQQVWMMLIFKAWAKICGSYSAIQGQDCFSVLNAFSPGPCFTYLLHPSLTEDKEAVEEIRDSLNNHWNSICVTTSSQPKYNLKADHNYAVRSFRHDKIQLVGQGIGQNISHKITLDNLFESCVEMAVDREDYGFINSPEMELQLTTNQPLFLKLDLWEQFHIILSFWWEQIDNLESFIRVAIGQQKGQNRYRYITSRLEAYYNEMSIDCSELSAGTYYLMIMMTAPTQRTIKANLIHYRKLKGQLCNITFQPCNDQIEMEPFLNSILHDYSIRAKNQTIRELMTSGSTLHIEELYRKGGFGYVTIKAGSKANLKYLRAKLDKRQIEKSKYILLESQEELTIPSNTSHTLVYLLRSPHKDSQPVSFPPGLSILQIF